MQAEHQSQKIRRHDIDWLRDYAAVFVATAFVVLFCWVFFEGVRRTKTTRFLFGIK